MTTHYVLNSPSASKEHSNDMLNSRFAEDTLLLELCPPRADCRHTLLKS